MIPWNLEGEIIRSEAVLRRKEYDFSAKYLAVCHLHRVARDRPETIRMETIAALQGIFHDSAISRQTQSFFLFEEAAKVLCLVAVSPNHRPFCEEATTVIMSLLGTMEGRPQRAVADALGSLPVSIRGPEIKNGRVKHSPRVNWQNVLEGLEIRISHPPSFMGRSLVGVIDGDGRLLVIKLASADTSASSLCDEALWLEHIRSNGPSFPMRFNIPDLINVRGSHLFRLSDIPARLPEKTQLHPEHYAIGYISHRDYFTYPNDERREYRLTEDVFKEVMLRNAFLFGRLSSRGIVHTAPIPLFHNRVQAVRRRDSGLYEWQRAGRLDRWLNSCRYPNFGLTGIRDFEHLFSFKGGSINFYRHIGTQLLSLFLVTGSYFRNKDRGKIGFDSEGNAVDARELFDAQFLREMIRGIFKSYYHGFAGRGFSGFLPVDFDKLSARMVDEMGIDRHMEEILRVTDQREMTDNEFVSFLGQRGFTDEAANRIQKGRRDITLQTGPHLGGFNQRTSLPELNESIGCLSALCIFGRYCAEKSGMDPQSEVRSNWIFET
ncbi:MAG: SidJ-related pseudokinase [Deltaproteobacteria bacterium]|nr:SidJ-related pseudokinase [Deltaproteobacteria bacterium]